jgi:hypothetical protein
MTPAERTADDCIRALEAILRDPEVDEIHTTPYSVSLIIARYRELEADADRLDWLDEHPYRIVPHIQHGWSIQAGGPFETTIRAAIDSARKQ